MDVAIANSQNLRSTITEKLQKYTDLTEELMRIRQLQTPCTVPPVPLTSGYHSKQITRQLKTDQSSPCSIYCNAESRILNICCIVRKYVAE